MSEDLISPAPQLRTYRVVLHKARKRYFNFNRQLDVDKFTNMNTIMSWNVRGMLIGGLFLSAKICHASTINAPKISPKAPKVLPQIRFLKKETIVPIRVNIVHSPILDVR